jgi:hypothetical protein
MTHPVPYTRVEQDKTIANAVNHAFRHCRIGKVMPKPRPDTGLCEGALLGFRYVAPKDSSYLWDRIQACGFVSTGSCADVPIVPSHGVML